jgi:hypothetical protein
MLHDDVHTCEWFQQASPRGSTKRVIALETYQKLSHARSRDGIHAENRNTLTNMPLLFVCKRRRNRYS